VKKLIHRTVKLGKFIVDNPNKRAILWATQNTHCRNMDLLSDLHHYGVAQFHYPDGFLDS
jgi:hypothetical protein